MGNTIGREKHLTPFSIADEREVIAGQRLASNNGIQALVALLTGDASWWGAKRGLYRPFDLMARPTDPPSMTVQLRLGNALLNDGEEHSGDWYLVFSDSAQVTMPPAHSTLDRWDIIALAPKRTDVGSVNRETIDGAGNVVIVEDHSEKHHDFEVQVFQGEPGGSKPEVGSNREFVHTHSPVGTSPVAAIRVRAGASTVDVDDILDLREIFVMRNFSGGQTIDEADIAIYAGGGLIPPNHQWQPVEVYTDDALDRMTGATFFLDRRPDGAVPGVLKFKRIDATILDLEGGS